MLLLLSPAKRLNKPPANKDLDMTTPALLSRAEELVQTGRGHSVEELCSLMSISNKLGVGVAEMFAGFHLPFTPENARQAVFSFAGDVYVGLDAATLSVDDLQWSQNHLAILSGLYGLLRPLDLMQPYRLEMGTKLKTSHSETLYSYWGRTITDEINQRGDKVILNLASNEYFKSVQTKSLNASVVTPRFLEKKDEKERIISFFAKKARGLMARWVVQNRITDPADLVGFDLAGYRYQPEGSDGSTLVFSRPQPAPVTR